MKKKIIVVCIIIVLMLTSMAAYLFYVPRYEKVVARNGDDLVFSNIPYYYYSDGCGNILNNYSLLVPDVDEKIEEYISKMYKSGDFLVSDYNGGICINRYVGNEKDVVIPEKIDGKNVIKIGLYFERSWDDTSDGIDGSIYFQRNAFYETGVKSIYLPSGLKEIVMYSFYISEKNSLKSIKVSKENPYYLSVNGILFSKKPLKVLCIPGVYYLE